MTNIPCLRYGLFVLGLLFTCNGHGQIVSEFRDWEQYAGGGIDQGPDGPCEYITRTWAVEYAVRMYYRDSGTSHDNPYVDLSEQHIWQRCFERLPEYYPDCIEYEGIKSHCMADFITDHGIANEACLMSTDSSGNARFDRTLLADASNEVCIDPCIEAPQIDRYRFRAPLEYVYSASQLGIHSNDDLKKAIIKYGPHSLYVQEGVNWPYTFDAGEHAILIVGWTSSGKWRFKNSSTRYFEGKGVTGIGELAFDIGHFGSIKVGRVIGEPECEGFACSDFARRYLDYDGDGFCSIKWGNLPAGVSCKGHDANDTNSAVGPYTDCGYKTKLASGSTVTLSSYETLPTMVRATSKGILTPGFKYDAQDCGRNFTAFIGNTF